MIADPKIIIALDIEDESTLIKLISELDPSQCRLKIGKTLFTQYGPSLIETCQEAGFEVFLDLKFHDIPQQVAGACSSAAKLGVWMTNVHASGGLTMLKAARAAIDEVDIDNRPLLIGVTILTSLNTDDLKQIGIQGTPEEAVIRLAGLCFEAKLDGVVCSAQEAKILKQHFGPQFLCVTPGIRLPEDNHQDQQRVMTPVAAISAGSDYLVMGRSITHAPDPLKILKEVNESLCQ